MLPNRFAVPVQADDLAQDGVPEHERETFGYIGPQLGRGGVLGERGAFLADAMASSEATETA